MSNALSLLCAIALFAVLAAALLFGVMALTVCSDSPLHVMALG